MGCRVRLRGTVQILSHASYLTAPRHQMLNTENCQPQ